MSNFEETSKSAKEYVGSQLFIKLKENEIIKGIMRGDFVMQMQHWLQGQGKSVDCSKSGCVYCEQGLRVSVKYSVNFIYYDGEKKAYEAKVLSCSPALIANISSALKITGALIEDSIIGIQKTGSGKETRYAVQIVGALSEEQKVLVGQIELKDIYAIMKIERPANDEPAIKAESLEKDDFSDVPF